jgi:electron transfer flavoprotein alpha/beta subunit
MSLQVMVCLKLVPDNTQLKFDPMGHPVLANATSMLNPYDEYALESALTLKDAMVASGNTDVTVTVVSIGPASGKEMLKKAIAAGADAGCLLSDATFDCCPGQSPEGALSRAVILKHLLADANPDAGPMVVFCGHSALDTASGTTGPMLAEALQATFLSPCTSVGLAPSATSTLLVQWEAPATGLQTITLPYGLATPLVLGCGKGVKELRSANIKGVMRANKTDVPVLTLADIGLEASTIGPATFGFSVLDRTAPPARPKGQLIDGNRDPDVVIADLMQAIKQLQH